MSKEGFDDVYIIRTIYAGQYVSYDGTSRHIDCARTFYSQEYALEYLNEYWNGTGEIIGCEIVEGEHKFFDKGELKNE